MRHAFTWLRKFLRGHKPALVGTCFLLIILIAAMGASLITSTQPLEAIDGPQHEMSFSHPLGLDTQGYDIWTRIVYGSRTTLWIALSATLLSLVMGVLIGGIAGYAGGKVDLLLMRGIDFLMSFPSFLLAMVVVAVLGTSQDNLILAVGMVSAPMIARQIRAEVLRVSAMGYIDAGRSLGLSPPRLFFRHVLPNSLAPIIVLGTLGMGSAVLDVAGLNFLGLGGDPYVPEWGLILKQGWDEGSGGRIQVAAAGVAIFITVLGFNLLGDGLKDELDPRTRKR